MEKKHQLNTNRDFWHDFAEDTIPDYIAYTDGSCNNLSPYGEGGSAYVLCEDKCGCLDPVLSNSKGFLYTTNNRMEMLAIISVLLHVPAGNSVEVRTDNQYCIRIANFTPPFGLIANKDLVEMLYNAMQGKSVHITWVKGHSGEELNELCDQLANERMLEQREKYNIPVYSTRYRNYKTQK